MEIALFFTVAVFVAIGFVNLFFHGQPRHAQRPDDADSLDWADDSDSAEHPASS